MWFCLRVRRRFALFRGGALWGRVGLCDGLLVCAAFVRCLDCPHRGGVYSCWLRDGVGAWVTVPGVSDAEASVVVARLEALGVGALPMLTLVFAHHGMRLGVLPSGSAAFESRVARLVRSGGWGRFAAVHSGSRWVVDALTLAGLSASGLTGAQRFRLRVDLARVLGAHADALEAASAPSVARRPGLLGLLVAVVSVAGLLGVLGLRGPAWGVAVVLVPVLVLAWRVRRSRRPLVRVAVSPDADPVRWCDEVGAAAGLPGGLPLLALVREGEF